MQINRTSQLIDDLSPFISKTIVLPVLNIQLHPSGIWTSKNYTKKLVRETFQLTINDS